MKFLLAISSVIILPQEIFIRYCRFVIVLLSIFCFVPYSDAADIVVATDTWEGYTNKDGRGYYLDILRAVFPEPDFTLIIKYMPYKRALMLVKHGEADLTTGVAPGDMPGRFIDGHYLEIETIDAVVSTELASNWQGLQSLKNKDVIAKIGYEFDRNFGVPIHYSEKASLLAMLQMLQAGRTDAVLDYRADIQKEWDAAGLGDDFIIIPAVTSDKAYLAFSLKRQDLRKHFEKTFVVLIQDGTVAEIRRKHQIAPDHLPQPQ